MENNGKTSKKKKVKSGIGKWKAETVQMKGELCGEKESNSIKHDMGQNMYRKKMDFEKNVQSI